MNFDIKDVKSWANRHDVKIKAVTGFFGNSLSEIDNEIRRYNKGEKDHLHELYKISDNGCYCFGYAMYFADTGAFGGTQTFAFFLPLDAVKEDKPKKKYRPFKTISELEYELNKGNRNVHQFLSVGNDIFIRNKNKNQITHLIITRIDIDAETNEILFVNDMSPKTLLDNYEIRVGAEWLPFGVEVEDEY